MIKSKLYSNIDITKVENPLYINSEIPTNDMLKATVYYDDAWTSVKGIISYHYGTGQGSSFPPVTESWVKYAVDSGYMLVICHFWNNFPSGYTYNNYFPSDSVYLGEIEQQSFIEFIEDIVKKEATYNKFLKPDTSIFLVGQSKGAGQILGWSGISKSMYPTYAGKVKAILANSPSGGGNTLYANYPRHIREIGSAINGVEHPSVVLFPIGDVTHLNRSFAELIVPYTSENSNVSVVVYGNSLEYGHSWVYKKPLEFIELAIDIFSEY